MKHWKSSLISFFFLLLKSQSFLINFCLEYCNYCDLFFSNSFDHRYWKPVASLFNTTFVMLFSHTKLTLEHIDRLGVLTLCAMENPWSVLMICDSASMDSNKQRLHQFSRSFMSDSLWPHESQHTRPPCPSPTPRDYPNSCPSSWWCHPAIWSSVVPFSSCSPIPPIISAFSNESTLHMRRPKYWSFSFNISPSNEHPRLISFRMDWLDLLAVQGTLQSLLQHHSSKASILRCSAFFTV